MKTLKKLLFIIMAVAVLAMPVFGVQAAESDIPVTEQPGVSPTPSPVPIRELVTKGNKIYYYYKGKMVKNKWKRYNGYKYIMAISIILAQMEMLCGEDSVSTM